MTEPRHPAIPSSINVAEAVSQLRQFSGPLAAAQLPRLTEAVLALEGPMTVRLRCLDDIGSLGRVAGQLQGQVQLTCQRCLQAMSWPLAADADWTLVASEAEEERLLDSCDPVLIHEGQLALHEAIEDELLMALPIAPMCALENCPNKSRANDGEVGDNRRPGEARPSPFAALKGQIKR